MAAATRSTHAVFCLMCVTIPALWAARVTIEDTQASYNADIVSVLVKQVQDLQSVVKAQGEEAYRLETVVKAQGEEVERLKTVVEVQNEHSKKLETAVRTQGEELRELKAEVKAKNEKLRLQDVEIQDLKTTLHAAVELNALVKEECEMLKEKLESEPPHQKLDGIRETSDFDSLLQPDSATNGKLSRGIREAEGVAFTAYLNHELVDVSLHHVIKPEKALLNDGNAYNIHTGVFTAPATGVYLFIYFIEDSRVGEEAGIRLLVDDVHEVDAYIYPNNGHGVMGGNSAILRVNAGQAVWLESYYNDDADLLSRGKDRFVTFSGFRIY